MKVVDFSAISKVKATENRDVGNFIYIFGKGREGGLGRGRLGHDEFKLPVI